MFDKTLYHEVQPTAPSELSDVGRWTTVIGARYPKQPSIFDRSKRFSREMAATVKSFVRVLVKPALTVRDKSRSA